MGRLTLAPGATLVALIVAVAGCRSGDDLDALIYDTAGGGVYDDSIPLLESLHSDADILGALHQAHLAEIDAGRLAEPRAVDSAVAQYARAVAIDHIQLDELGIALGRKLNVPTAWPNDRFANSHQRTMLLLSRVDTAPAADDSIAVAPFDHVYLDQQIRSHERWLALLDTAAARAQDTTLRSLIVNDVRRSVLSHLERAREIRERVADR